MQWEYACRAGTSWQFYTGPNPESLKEHVNLLDEQADKHSTWAGAVHWVNDGHVVHAPVGAFEPNPWGFHDMLGNVWEWCRDIYYVDSYIIPTEPGSGLRLEELDSRRIMICRGGCYMNPPKHTRCAERFGGLEDMNNEFFGLRPARALRAQ